MKFKFLVLILLIPQLAFAYYVRRPCCSRFQACGWWASAEYMLLWRKGRFFPPLVTTNPTDVPVLDLPGTTVLFGDKRIGRRPKSGFRGDFGVWLTSCLGLGLSGYALSDEEKKFRITGTSEGTPIFGQPFFFDIGGGGIPSVNLLSFPTLQINGEVDIDTHNRLWGADFYIRRRFFNALCFKFDILAGVLFNKVHDNLTVNTRTQTVALPTTTVVSDRFAVENEFVGGLAGFVADWRSCNWGINVIGKVGIGRMRSEVEIKGTTTSFSFASGTFTVLNSGFLAQPSNIGNHVDKKFELIPQISANIQLRIWPHIWATVGYTFIYWQSIALAGKQVDLNINPTQATGLVGTPLPTFHRHHENFWVQGLTAGLYFCY